MIKTHPRHDDILKFWAAKLNLPDDAFTGQGSRHFFQEDWLINRRIKLYKLLDQKTVVIIPESLQNRVHLDAIQSDQLLDEAALHQAMPDVDFKLRWRDPIYYLHPDDADFDESRWQQVQVLTGDDAPLLDNLKAACSSEDVGRAILDIDDPLVIGYFDEQKMVGAAGFLYEGDHIADIGVLVHPDYRRQGIAGVMTQYLSKIGLAQGKIVQYMTEDTNPHSMQVAQNNGFSLYFVEEGYEVPGKPR